MTTYNSDAPVLDTYQAVVSAYSDFLTVAIHTILYERNIYPQASFIKARKYDYPVRQNRHPKVCKWIQDAVAAVEVEMLKVRRLDMISFPDDDLALPSLPRDFHMPCNRTSAPLSLQFGFFHLSYSQTTVNRNTKGSDEFRTLSSAAQHALDSASSLCTDKYKKSFSIFVLLLL